MNTRLTARLLRGTAFTAMLVSLHGCTLSERADNDNRVPPETVLLRGAGATFAEPIYKTWFEDYERAHSGIAIKYHPVGSIEGVKRFMHPSADERDNVDFGASDVAMTDAEIAQVPRGVVLVPATAGTVVLAYNLPNVPGDLKLSREACAGIFLGRIKTWDNPAIAKDNPGVRLPNHTIVTAAREDGSGTTVAFTKYLSSSSREWRDRYGVAPLIDWPSHPMRGSGNANVAGLVEHSEGAIGYMGYEFARRLGLKIALMENEGGHFVRAGEQGGAASISEADPSRDLRLFAAGTRGPDAYPIVTFSWILLYQHYDDPRKTKALLDLVRWGLTEGQRLGPDLGYVPLPANITSKTMEALDRMAPGE
jgi:phosphate transport system substrate-binding protein